MRVEKKYTIILEGVEEIIAVRNAMQEGISRVRYSTFQSLESKDYANILKRLLEKL